MDGPEEQPLGRGGIRLLGGHRRLRAVVPDERMLNDPDDDQGRSPADREKWLQASEKIIVALLVIIGVSAIVALFQMMA